MSWTVVRGADLRPTPWRNGLGVTRDVVTRLGPDGGLLWQVSIADLVQDSPFSHFPHCDRVFTPIEGAPPPELSFEGGPFEPCPLLVPRRFSGEAVTACRVPAPARAFNVIYDRRLHAAAVTVMHLDVGTPVPDTTSGTVERVVHCLGAEFEADGAVAMVGDSLIGAASALTACRAGVALVVEVR